jgi:peptide/nickel transport system permease protein
MGLIARKLAGLIPVLLAVSALTFLLLNLLPGDPAFAILGPSATHDAVIKLHHQLGLDQPMVVRYGHWLAHVLTGNLGRSYLSSQPVLSAIKERLPVTVELVLLSQFVALLFAVPLGILAGRRPNGILDRVSTGGAFGFLAVPNFVLGVVLVYLFAVRYHLFPATGYTPLTKDPFQNLRSVVLPVITLAMAEIAAYLRLLRSDVITTLQEDYIVMAKAKGLPDRRIMLRHALRPSLFSLVTVAGLNFGRLIGGTFIVEIIFQQPGIGLLSIQSIYGRDYVVVQGTVLLIAVAYVLANFVVDVAYGLIDPRVRHATAG